jgi:hypothetical protein
VNAVDWSVLETSLDPDPEFFVQAPDGRKDWTELQRQTTFLRCLHMAGPRVLVFANANAGKRNPRKAKAEGIKAGVFDITCLWRGPLTAYIEFKGYAGQKRKQAGSLTRNQVEFGNRCTQLGIPAACFFDPYDAIDWLREQGFPIAAVRRG